MKYLEHKEFLEVFQQHFKSCQNFFKLETLPEYDDFNEEFNIENWNDVDAIKMKKLIDVCITEAEEEKERFTERKAKGFQHLRIRYVPYPLTKYILIELSSFAASQTIGKEIKVIEDSGVKKLSPNLMNNFSDFLLFDEDALLVIDNPNGITKCKAYYTQNQEEILPFLALRNELVRLSLPLNDYMDLLNLTFVNVSSGQ